MREAYFVVARPPQARLRQGRGADRPASARHSRPALPRPSGRAAGACAYVTVALGQFRGERKPHEDHSGRITFSPFCGRTSHRAPASGTATACACCRRCCAIPRAAGPSSGARSGSPARPSPRCCPSSSTRGWSSSRPTSSATSAGARSAARRCRSRSPPTAAYAVGLDFGHRHIRSAVCDLGGEIVADQWAAIDVDDHPIDSLDLAHQLTAAALAEAGVATDARDRRRGRAAPRRSTRATGARPRRGHPARAGTRSSPRVELEQRLGMPVQIENDANAGAMGEHLFGAGRGVADMVYLRLSGGRRPRPDPRRAALRRRQRDRGRGRAQPGRSRTG